MKCCGQQINIGLDLEWINFGATYKLIINKRTRDVFLISFLEVIEKSIYLPRRKG